MADVIAGRLVYNHFPTLIGQLHSRARDVVRVTVFGVQAHARAGVRVDTGTLKNSVMTNFEDDLHGSVDTVVDYAIPQEYGTVHMTGRPAFTEAAERMRPSFESGMRSLLGS